MGKSRITRAERARGQLSHVDPADWYPRRYLGMIVLRPAASVDEAKKIQHDRWRLVATENQAIPLLLTGDYYIDMTTDGTKLRNIIHPSSVLIDGKPIDAVRAEHAIQERPDREDAPQSKRVDRKPVQDELAVPPDNPERLRRLAEVLARPQQARFRQALRDRYGDGCQITGCPVMATVQAAHVQRVAEGGRDVATNGLLLRADIHALFDLDLIGIDPDDPDGLRVHVHPSLSGTQYYEDYGRSLLLPASQERRPDKTALRKRWAAFIAQTSRS